MFGPTLPIVSEPTYTFPTVIPNLPVPDQIKDEMIRFLIDENKRLREELERERKR